MVKNENSSSLVTEERNVDDTGTWVGSGFTSLPEQ